LDVVNITKFFPGTCFDTKDLGEADVILGIKITRTKEVIRLNQSQYIKKILKKFGQFDCTPIRIHYDPSFHLKMNKGDRLSQGEYTKIIAS